MERFDNLLSMLDHILNTKKKKTSLSRRCFDECLFAFWRFSSNSLNNKIGGTKL